MFGRQKEQDRARAAAQRDPVIQVQPGVQLPFHDFRSSQEWHRRKAMLTGTGTRATATIGSVTDVGTVGQQYIRQVQAHLVPDGAAPFDTTAIAVSSARFSPYQAGSTVTAYYDPSDPATVAFVVQQQATIIVNGNVIQAGGVAAAPGPRWKVPSECPNCGSPVDTATACMAADPRCDHCHLPIPVEPYH